ncbi:MAG: hypothetical protein GX235_07915 [Clostridiales bacterium]|nr:hypothetical protein [Clostridiales bacterium]
MQAESFALHIAICDDNVGDRKQMERLLQRESDKRTEETGTFYIDSYGSISAIMTTPMIYDAFFIDMTSEKTNGAALALLLRDAGVAAPIILCVSSVDYRKLFLGSSEKEKHNILFLDKPIKKEELSNVLDHLVALKSQIVPTIELRGEKITRYVEEDDIVYAKADGNYIHVYLKDRTSISILSTITNFYSQLAAYTHYAAVSRTSMINVAYLKKVSFTKLMLTDGTVIRTTPSYCADIKKALRQYTEEL